MAIINLRDYYPFYTSDCFMEVSEEVAEMFKEFDRKEAAYRLRTYRHKAYYSLDRDDGLEHEALFVALLHLLLCVSLPACFYKLFHPFCLRIQHRLISKLRCFSIPMFAAKRIVLLHTLVTKV